MFLLQIKFFLITAFHFPFVCVVSFPSPFPSFCSLCHPLSWPCCLIYGKRSARVPVVISHRETVTNIVYFGKLGHRVVDCPLHPPRCTQPFFIFFVDTDSNKQSFETYCYSVFLFMKTYSAQLEMKIILPQSICSTASFHRRTPISPETAKRGDNKSWFFWGKHFQLT